MLVNQEGIFTVKGSKDKIHTVSFGVEAEDGMPSCTCADWQQWHVPCKHFFAVYLILKMDGHGIDFIQTTSTVPTSALTPCH